jgi:chorismate dehydratase
MEKIKVGAVNYLNTKPLLYGIHHLPIINKIDLITDYPAKIAEALLDGKIDIGLVPIAIIPRLQKHYIVSDYCIGAEDAVASVCLFSEVPLEEIKTVWLDYQSKTSVNLARILLKNYWKKDVVFLDAMEGYQQQIKGTTAGVVIGDRAFVQRLVSPYIYDLAAAWKAYTNLPFVFAAWIANKPLPQDFINDFNSANQYGLDRMDQVIAENPYNNYNLETYYKKNISYRLTDKKLEGLSRFLEELSALG